MAITNHERIGKALELLKSGLAPFVARELTSVYRDRAFAKAGRFLGEDRLNANRAVDAWDVAALLKLMWDAWNDVFRTALGPAERSLVSELRDVGNRWAHQQPFSGDDVYRALDSASRLITAVSAPQAEEINRMKRSTVMVTLEIEAEVPSGTPDHVVRIVTENSRTLKFTNLGFETE